MIWFLYLCPHSHCVWVRSRRWARVLVRRSIYCPMTWIVLICTWLIFHTLSSRLLFFSVPRPFFGFTLGPPLSSELVWFSFWAYFKVSTSNGSFTYWHSIMCYLEFEAHNGKPLLAFSSFLRSRNNVYKTAQKMRHVAGRFGFSIPLVIDESYPGSRFFHIQEYWF